MDGGPVGRPVGLDRRRPRPPRALDAAEIRIRHPSPFPARGELRDQLAERRRLAELELADIDRELADVLARRRRMLERVDRCHVALAGTGEIVDPRTGQRLQRLPGRRPPRRDPQPTSESDAPTLVSGGRLCAAVRSILDAVGGPLDIPEIEHLLRLQGFAVPGRASHTISNAVRSALSDGSIVRLGRGRYGPGRRAA
jgi:hypothetical protein